MNLLKNFVILLFLVGFYAPSYASVAGVELVSCSVFSASDENGDKKGDKKGDKQEEDEEEPDCE